MQNAKSPVPKRRSLGTMAPSRQCSDSAPKIPDLQQYYSNYHDYHSAHFEDHTRTSYDSLPGGLHDPSDEEVKTSTCLAHSAGTQRSEDECSCSDGPRLSYAWPHAPDMEEKESDNNRRIGRSHSRTPTPSMIEAKFMPSRTPTPTLGEPSLSDKPSPIPSKLKSYYHHNVERAHHRSRSHSSERLTATISRFSDLGVRETSSSSRKRHGAYHPFSEHYRDDFAHEYEYKRNNREEKLEDEEDAKRERESLEKRRSRSERGGMGGNVNENVDFGYEVKHLHDESPRSSNLRNRENFPWEDAATSGPYRVRSCSSSSTGSSTNSNNGGGSGNIKPQPRPSPGCARGRTPTNGAPRRVYPIGTSAPCSSSSSSSSPPQNMCSSPRAAPPHLAIPPSREDSYPNNSANVNYSGSSTLPSTRPYPRITISSPLKTVTTLLGPPPLSPRHHSQCLLSSATSLEHCSISSTVNSSSSTVPFQICSACLTTPFTLSSPSSAPPCVFGAFASSLPVSLHSSSMSHPTTTSIPYSPHAKPTRSSYASVSKPTALPLSRASSYGSTYSSCSGSSLASAGSLSSFACPGCSSSSSSMPLPSSSSSMAPSSFPLSPACPPTSSSSSLPAHLPPLILPTELDSRPSTPTTDTSSTPTSQRSGSNKSRNRKQHRKPSGSHNRSGSLSQKLSGKEEKESGAGHNNDNSSNDSVSRDVNVDHSSNSGDNSSAVTMLHIKTPCSPAVSSSAFSCSSPVVSLDSTTSSYASSLSSNFLHRHNSNVFSPSMLSSSTTPLSNPTRTSSTPLSHSTQTSSTPLSHSTQTSSCLLPSQRGGNHSCSTLVEESSSPSSSSGFPPSVVIHSHAPTVVSPSFLARGTSNSTVSSSSNSDTSPAAIFHVRPAANSSTPTSASGPTLMPSRRDSAGGSPHVSRRESIVTSFVATAAMLRRDSGSPPLTSRRDSSSSSTLPVISGAKARRMSQSARRLSSEWEYEEVQAARRGSLPSHDFGFVYGPIKNRKCVVRLSDPFGGGDITVKCSPDASLAELQALAIQKFQKANRKSSSSAKEKFWRLGRSHNSSPTSQSPEPSDHESPWYQALSHARRQPPSPPVATAKSPSRPSLSGNTSLILGDSRRASVTSMRANGGGLRAVLPHPTNHEDGKLGFRSLVILLSYLRQKNVMEARAGQLDLYDPADVVKAQDFLDQLEQKPPLGKSPFLYPLPADLEDFSKVICTERGYESVMRFLSVEYSQENLEFWKAVTDLEWKFTRPEVQVIELRKQAQALYHTFIDSCSVHTVNVSSATANAFRTHLMDPNIPMETLLQLCESAKDEIVRLLKGDSFRRYQESKFYKILATDAHKYHAKLAKKRR